jgi:hypothetical protein
VNPVATTIGAHGANQTVPTLGWHRRHMQVPARMPPTHFCPAGQGGWRGPQSRPLEAALAGALELGAGAVATVGVGATVAAGGGAGAVDVEDATGVGTAPDAALASVASPAPCAGGFVSAEGVHAQRSTKAAAIDPLFTRPR